MGQGLLSQIEDRRNSKWEARKSLSSQTIGERSP
jgi:hypothetical protein